MTSKLAISSLALFIAVNILLIQSARSEVSSENSGSLDSVGIEETTDVPAPSYDDQNVELEDSSLNENNSSFNISAVDSLILCPFYKTIQCNPDRLFRSADGSCNNIMNPYWGKAETPYKRLQSAYYDDELSEPRNTSSDGSPLPNPRIISLKIHHYNERSLAYSHQITHFTMAFGQFLSHDLLRTNLHSSQNLDCCSNNTLRYKCLPIPIPKGDPYFPAADRKCISVGRAIPTVSLNCLEGPKEILNKQTSFLDGSQIYGSSRKETLNLRTLSDGLMRTSDITDNQLLPINRTAFCRDKKYHCFTAGDARVNQNNMLVSLHTVFLREHNRIAKALAEGNPYLSDDVLFEEARQINIAQIQHIVYKEYLPQIIGASVMLENKLLPLSEGYTEYKPNINPAINLAFAGAAFRFGHSTVRKTFSSGKGRNILLSRSFNRNDPFYENEDAVTDFVRGLLIDKSLTVDSVLTDQLTDHLFETPGLSNGRDLAAINILRGRDMGLKPYIYWRKWCGLYVPESFSQLVDHSFENQAKLRHTYSVVDDIDLWTGGLSEEWLSGSRLGPTFTCIVAQQFKVLKQGDRFWYENSGPQKFTYNQLQSIRQSSMARILCDNTQLRSMLPNPFFTLHKTNPILKCKSLPKMDLCYFIQRWSEWSFCKNLTRRKKRYCISPKTGRCACSKKLVEDYESC